MFFKNHKLRLVLWLILAILAAFIALLFTPKPQPISISDYEITSKAIFNQTSYYPLQQNLDPKFYRPTGTWVGRLILPQPEQVSALANQNSDWVWLEVYHTPEDAQNLVGQVVRLSWKQDQSILDYVKLVTQDIQFTEATEKSQQEGNVVPSRLNGRLQVSPLQSLAGARPNDDVLVSLEEASFTTDDQGKPLIKISQFPVLVPSRYYTLVDIVETVTDNNNTTPTTCPGKSTCPSELFRVRHYNPDSAQFDGLEEIIRIPQQPPLKSGRFASTPRQLVKSPVGKAGWYLYGAKGKNGIFTVQAIKPRSLFQLQPNEVVLGETAALTYLNQRNWQDTPKRKGTTQSVLVDAMATSEEKALSDWQIGEKALLIHLFGGIGGKKAESTIAGTVTGHFAYGLAQVVRDPFTRELQFEIDYQQVYAQNSQGILSGSHTWQNYMGGLQRGWLGTRPVSDVIVKFAPLDDYNFDGIVISPLQELQLQLQVMMARYRTGDGTGNSSVTPASSCVQDSNQALYIAIEEIKEKVQENPEIASWLEAHPDHRQTARFQQLVALGKDLEARLTPQGVVRADWKQNAETLAAVKRREQLPLVRDGSIASVLLSWRSMLPRGGYDTISRTFLLHGAKLWFLRTNQVGGWDLDIEPVAPTVLFGDVPIVSVVLRRILLGLVSLPNLRDWWILLVILLAYGAIALPIGFASGFLQWSPHIYPFKNLFSGMITTFFCPALIEELVFRVAWLPHPSEEVKLVTWILWAALGLGLFMVYHPLNALTFYRQGNPTFFNPIFLSLTDLLGLACTIVYFLSGSLWTVTLLHWLIVVVWLFGLGGNQKLIEEPESSPIGVVNLR